MNIFRGHLIDTSAKIRPLQHALIRKRVQGLEFTFLFHSDKFQDHASVHASLWTTKRFFFLKFKQTTYLIA